jgi:hypothetical protein
VRPARWGSGFLRCGIDPGAAPTVCFAAPPLAVFGCAKRSLRSHARINPSTQPSDVARASRSRAGELTLGLLSGEERVVDFGFVVDWPLTPALSRGRGGRFVGFSKLEFDSIFHVGVAFPDTSISPLSLRAVRRFGRVRVRGLWSWRVSCKSPVNRHKTSARGHCRGARNGKRFSQKVRAAQASRAQPGEEQEGRR